MDNEQTVYIMGTGAVGMTLATSLVNNGIKVIAVHMRNKEAPRETVRVSLNYKANFIQVSVDTIGFSNLPSLDGVVVIAVKSYVNDYLAANLCDKINGPVVILQNGISVEDPFIEARFPRIYRSVLYLTSQCSSRNAYEFYPFKPSPIGIVNGNEQELQDIVTILSTTTLPFHPTKDIQKDIWNKAIINIVFNSICALLDVDNGVFERNKVALALAKELVSECIALAEQLNLELRVDDLLAQIVQISKNAHGTIASTLQDIRRGQETEIEFLNLELVKIGERLTPKIKLPKTNFIGQLVLTKSIINRVDC